MRSISDLLHDDVSTLGEPHSLCRFPEYMQGSQVTDQRDRACASLGMARPQDRSALKVNHSKPIQLLLAPHVNSLTNAGHKK